MTTYLTETDISEIRTALVAMFAGDETISPLGVRDQNLIASACGRPAAGFGDVEKYPSVAAKAAALLHALIANHPFWNANKRSALVAMVVFLEKNGQSFGDNAPDDVIVDVVTRVAARGFPSADRGRNADAVVAALATWIGTYITPNCTVMQATSNMGQVLASVLARFGAVLHALADA